MVHIAVIDDKKEILDKICLLLQKTTAMQDDVKICPFTSAEEFLESAEGGVEYTMSFS